jgi:hypothetical protein
MPTPQTLDPHPHKGSHLGKALLLVAQQALLLPACLQAAWAGGGGRAEWHVRTFLLLKVGCAFGPVPIWFAFFWIGLGKSGVTVHAPSPE